MAFCESSGWLRSPVSDDGRGLKHEYVTTHGGENTVRPSVMTGVD